jgi:hypothetical protein
VTDAFRCSAASLTDGEPMAGTAPTDASYLLVEHPGPWGRDAVADSPLPPAVREHLAGLPDTRVQLVRRHGGAPDGPGIRVFSARPETGELRTAVLARPEDLLDLRPQDWAPYVGPLWLVCTNGRRDRCCAELGRPVAAALAAAWPGATWETTHLGGHRFAGTLVALPTGITLGRLDAESAVAACRALVEGRVPLDQVRGRSGLDPRAQVAELHLRRALGLTGLDEVRVTGQDGDDVLLEADGRTWRAVVVREGGRARRQSCGDGPAKPTPAYRVDAVGNV